MESQVSPPAPAPAPASEDKTVAIISYLTLIGFIVAVIVHSNKKTALGTFHLRQSLGILLCGAALGIVAAIPIIGWIAFLLGGLALLVFWILGLVQAIQGQMKPVPLIGEHFQKWFASTFS